MRKLSIPVVLLAITLITGCAGTPLKWSEVRKVKAGMTTEEVSRILGEPNDIFSRDGKLIYTWSSTSLSGSRGIRIEFKDDKATEAPAVPNSYKD